MSLVRRNQIPAVTPKKRCAVYTRKSTDEGLDQEYNTSTVPMKYSRVVPTSICSPMSSSS